jgi:hypothetical protein
MPTGVALLLLLVRPYAAALISSPFYTIYSHFLRHSRQQSLFSAVGYLFLFTFYSLKMFYYEQKFT